MHALISRQAAIDLWVKYHYSIATKAIEFDKELRELPSIQPDIIFCPDCCYNDGTAYCELHFRDVKAKDFCSWAERREE